MGFSKPRDASQSDAARLSAIPSLATITARSHRILSFFCESLIIPALKCE
jgi:hypothetical protein